MQRTARLAAQLTHRLRTKDIDGLATPTGKPVLRIKLQVLQRLSGIVLDQNFFEPIMNTVFHSEFHWHRYDRICRTPILGELLQILTSQSGLARSMHANSGLTKPSREHIGATYRGFRGSVRKMVLRVYRGLDPEIFQVWDTQLRALTAIVPSMVMWGDRDTYIASQFADRFGAREVIHFPDCCHWPMVEIPHIVSKKLLEHFSKPHQTNTLAKRWPSILRSPGAGRSASAASQKSAVHRPI